MKKSATRRKTAGAVRGAVPAGAASGGLAMPGAMVPPTGPASARKPHSLPDEAYPEGSTAIQDDFNDGNPFNERDWRVAFNAWAGFTLRILLIVGALFSVYQYLAAREEIRVGRTLDLVELWEKEEYQQAQNVLRRRIAALNEAHQNSLGTKPTPEEIAFYRDRLGLQALKPDGGDLPLAEFQEDFDRVIYFLNRLSSCVEEGLCSRRVADTFFRDYAESFWSYFSGYAAERRKAGETSYAMPIENYVAADR